MYCYEYEKLKSVTQTEKGKYYVKRLQEYYKEISPLMQFYADQGLLMKLDGTLAWPQWKALIEATVKTNK